MLLFATEKQLKGKVFPAFFRKAQKRFGRKRCLQALFSCTFEAKSTKSLRTSFSAGGYARGAQDQAYAPPRDCRAACRTLFFRVGRERGSWAAPLAARNLLDMTGREEERKRGKELFCHCPERHNRFRQAFVALCHRKSGEKRLFRHRKKPFSAFSATKNAMCVYSSSFLRAGTDPILAPHSRLYPPREYGRREPEQEQ